MRWVVGNSSATKPAAAPLQARSSVKTFKTAQYPGSMKVSSAHGFTWSGGGGRGVRRDSGGLNYAKNAQLVSERACKGPGRAARRRTQ